MGAHNPKRSYRSARNRRTVRTREPIEERVVVFVSAIAIILVCLAIAISPLSGPWSTPPIRAFLTGLSFGLLVPANFGYVLGFTLLLFVLTGFVWRQAARSWHARTAADMSVNELQAYSPSDFEEWVAAQFEGLGYSVKLTGMHADHGIDLLGEKPGEIAAVQCKNYRAWAVGEPALRDLLGAMQHYGADKGYLVTTGHLTQAALDWARGKPIEIWDADYLARLSTHVAIGNPMDQQRQQGAAHSAFVAPIDTDPGFNEPVAEAFPASAPHCPKCGSVLVERRNRQTGELFLACPGYPRCHHTQPLLVR